MAVNPSNPRQECCWHLAGQPFNVGGPGGREGQANTCCRHGEQRVIFTGPPEPGHGPFLQFARPDSRPKLIVPQHVLAGMAGR